MTTLEKVSIIVGIVVVGGGALIALVKWGWGIIMARITNQIKQEVAGHMVNCSVQAEIFEIKSILIAIQQRNEVRDETDMGLLMDRISQKIDYCCTRGWATAEDRKTLNQLYKSYKELNGNSFIDGYMKRIDDLCWTKEEYLEKMALLHDKKQ